MQISPAPGQNGWHFADNIFKCIFLEENLCHKFLECFPDGIIDKKSTLAWWHQAITSTKIDWGLACYVGTLGLNVLIVSEGRFVSNMTCLQWRAYEPRRKPSPEIVCMMTSSNGNISCVTGPLCLCGEFTGNRWIPPTKASGAELWYFLWSTPE